MDDSEYIADLSAVLKRRDPFALRAFLVAQATAHSDSFVDEVNSISDTDLEVRMYKMILTRSDLGDLHADARRWLNAHGMEFRAA